MSLVSKLTGRGDPIAQTEKEIAKHVRDLALAEAELAAAQEGYDSAFSSGENDDILDVAQRQIELARRKAQRGKLKGQALANQLTELKSKARADLQRSLELVALDAGVAHGEAARRAAQTAARFAGAIGELQARGFASTAAEYPTLPMTVMDFGQATSRSLNAPSPAHDLLERFVFLINGLRDRRATS